MCRLLLCFLAIVCTAMPAFADWIDQDQPSGPVYMAAFAQTDLAQSFMQASWNITGAGILLQAGIGGTDNVRISVWTGLPNAGGTMLAQAEAQGTQGQWVDVFWGDRVPTDAGVTYYLVFDGNTTLGIAGDVNNPYPHGCVYANPGFQQYPTFDYAFRTYTNTDIGHDEWGACCLGNGECRAMWDYECSGQGQWQGDVPCDPNPCLPTPTKSTTWGAIKGSYR